MSSLVENVSKKQFSGAWTPILETFTLYSVPSSAKTKLPSLMTEL
nr:hypothetical protein [Vibrio cholerae]